MSILFVIILLICVLSNIACVYLGYSIGRNRQIIEVKHNDSVKIVDNPKPVQYEDEPATWLTPEQEQALEAAYNKYMGDNNGI